MAICKSQSLRRAADMYANRLESTCFMNKLENCSPDNPLRFLSDNQMVITMHPE